MNVLAVSAHPDDIEINCAGTLARYAKRGDKVFMCNLCSGDMGHVRIMPDELARMRKKESENAAALIGAEHITLNIPDLRLFHEDEGTRDKLTDVIRYVKPDLIITHTPDDYMPDHIAAGKLVFGASFCASLPHYRAEIGAGAATDICPVFYMDNLGGFRFEPTEYVDVTEEIDTKMRMLACHVSQLKWMKDHDGIDFCETVLTFAKMRGLQSGVPYAEGFRQLCGWGRMATRRLLP